MTKRSNRLLLLASSHLLHVFWSQLESRVKLDITGPLTHLFIPRIGKWVRAESYSGPIKQSTQKRSPILATTNHVCYPGPPLRVPRGQSGGGRKDVGLLLTPTRRGFHKMGCDSIPHTTNKPYQRITSPTISKTSSLPRYTGIIG